MVYGIGSSNPREEEHLLLDYSTRDMSSSSYGYDTGTYREYKQCTRIFLDWIQNVVSKFSGKKNENHFPNTLSGLQKRVELIVSRDGLKESFYKWDLWKSVWKALKNGERAIRLRKEVNEFFVNVETGETNLETNELHAYFIRVLTFCHEYLNIVMSYSRIGALLSCDKEWRKHTNYRKE